jgi:hypothetical protein
VARTEIYDAVQNIFDKYNLLITPTLACLPVDNARDGNSKGPNEINGEPVDPLISPDLPDQFHRPSRDLDTGRVKPRSADRQADH